MLRTSIFLSLSLVTLVACGGTKKAADTTPAAATAPEASGQEIATGELREALLELKKVHFSLDSDTLSPEARTALSEAGTRIQRAAGVELYVEGHTDKRGTGEYNLALGERRSRAVTEYLVSLGVPAERLHVVSKGAEVPVAEGTSQADYAANRRVEFKLMRGSVQIVLGEGTLVDDQGNPLGGTTK